MAADAPAAAGPSANTAIAAVMLFLLTALLGLQPLSTDLYLPSLPAIGAHFDALPVAVQSTLSVFMLGFAVSQLVVGPMSDRFGRRPVVLAGLTTFVLASLAGALAPDLGWLVGARLLQSIGVCCTVLCARAVVRDLYEPEAGTRVMARAMGWMGLVTLTGPMVGGALQALLGWRATFAMLALVGGAVLVTATRVLGETNAHRNPKATRPRELGANYAAIARSATFRAFALAATASYMSLFSFISGSSFLLIDVLGLQPALYGVVFGSVTLGFMTGTLLTRRFEPVLGIAGTAAAGGAVSALAGWTMAALAIAGVASVPAVVVPMFFVLVGHGLVQPSGMIGAISGFPRNAGAAAALLGFAMFIAAAVTGWWVGASHDGTTLPLAITIAAITTLTATAGARLVRMEQRRKGLAG
ncbi:MAG TPA: multidrug effflux MFS transporter [Burkholderiaceae bacterium]